MAVLLILAGLPVLLLASGPSLADAGSTARENATILVMGDSISAAYGIQRDEGWVNLLSTALLQSEHAYKVVNASISGETTSGGLARLPQALDTHDPEVVLIELGGNDGLRGYPTETIQANLRGMVDLAREQNRAVVLIGMQIPPNYGPRYTRAFFDMYAQIAAETEVTLVPFFLEHVALEPGLMQDDGIHPTADAQPLLLETLWAYLEPLLEPETVSAELAR
jgi:acyl-CoA thioesterase-1